MNALASVIQDHMDALLDEYDRRLQAHPACAAMPAAFRRETARRILALAVDWLQSGEDTRLVQFIQASAQARVAQGLDPEGVNSNIGIMQCAVNELEAILDPLIQDVETGKFVWRTLSKTREVTTQQAVELLRQDNTARRRAEEAWRESEAKYSAVVTQAHDGVVIIQDNVIQFANPALANMLGYSGPEEIEHTPFVSYLAPESRAMVAERVKARLAGKEVPAFYEARLLRKDGAAIDIELSAGVVQYLSKPADVGLIRDITQRKRAEASLQESKQLLQLVMDNIPQSIFWKDTGLVYRGCNRQFVEEGSFASPDQIVGKTAYDMPWADNAEFYHADDRRVIETDTPKFNIEEPLRKGDGTLGWLRTNKIPMHDAQGQVIGILSTSEDITERKHAEQALHESQQLLQTVMDNIPQSIFWKDQNLTYLGCNRAFATDAGLASPSDAIGKTDWDMPWKEQAELYRADDRRVMESGAPKLDYEEPQTTPDGSTIWLRTSKVPLRDATDNVTAVLGMYEDITERKRLQRQIQESLERRGQQVQVSTQVAQEIAAAPALDELFRRVVTLVKERFGYYHAQILRFDPAQNAVVLVTGYGEAGQKMIAAGHRLAMGRGVVGTSAATGQSILATDVVKDKDWQPNPNLPDTQGELAVPIKLRDEVLGILDVQSARAGALTADDQLLLEGLCGQIAVAIEQKRAEASLAEERNLMRTLIDTLPDLIYVKDVASRFILANIATAEVMGAATPDDLLGKSDLDFYPRELAEQYMASERPILRDGIPLINHEEPNVDAAGHQKWDITTKVPLRDAQDQIIGLVGVTRDITEHKQAEMKLQETLQEVERLYRATTREGWQTFLRTGRLAAGYRYDRVSVRPDENVWAQPIEQAIQQNTLIASSGENAMAVAPFSVRGATIGALGVYDDPQHPLSPDELTLLQEMIEQGALALENARLYQDSQRLAAREQTINAIAANIRSVPTVDAILQRAAEELGRAFGASRASIRVDMPESAGKA